MTDIQEMDDGRLVQAILQAETRADEAARDLKQLKEELLPRKRNAIAQAYAAKDSQFGVVHLAQDGYSLDITTSLRVEWDQEKLAKLVDEIRDQWQSDPAEFIDAKLSVKESKYKAWPSDLKAKFEPARTVKASAPSLSITSKEKE